MMGAAMQLQASNLRDSVNLMVRDTVLVCGILNGPVSEVPCDVLPYCLLLFFLRVRLQESWRKEF